MMMSGTTSPAGGQFGDTTYTKVFVGGLAWEAQKDTMKKYFQQFGQILEAVVITDKATGRSKGYGFVTFREAESAMRACVDGAPVIDGRRANCNLASLGAHRSKPSTPNKHGGGRNVRIMSAGFGFPSSNSSSSSSSSSSSTTTFPHYAIQHQQGTIPYNLYGYSADYTYPTPTSYYGVYGGATMYGFYPYLQLGETSGLHHHHYSQMFHYSPPIQYASPGVTIAADRHPFHF